MKIFLEKLRYKCVYLKREAQRLWGMRNYLSCTLWGIDIGKRSFFRGKAYFKKHPGSKIIIGDICVLISTIMSSIANIYSKKLVQTIDSYVVTGFQLSIGGAMLLISGYILGGELTVSSTSSIILLIYSSIF